jgi:quinoprotein glucose dehydrogenase
MKNTFLLLSIALFLVGCQEDTSSTKAHHQSWEHYLGDPGRSHFSTLSEIDTSNVRQLQEVWSYNSGGLQEGRTSQMQTNPLIVGDKLLGVNASMVLFCIKADTGERLWEFKPPSVDNTGLGYNRGLSFWRSEGGEKSRVFFSSGFDLYAVDLETGKAIDSFGSKGSIDLREGLGRDPEKLSVFGNTPGAVYEDLLIMGTRVQESPGAAPGHIRAYNVISGKIEWTFHTIPQPGEPGYETWPKEAYQSIGGANNWAGMALDKERGIAFIPTGSAAFDWYGGNRVGDNLYSNTLLALNARTGEKIWHFQVVKHDLWDRDLPAPPNLVEVVQNGKKIPAVAQVTKSGHVFVFNRLTGESLFPIEYKEYPASTLEGEVAASTQALPLKPQPFARQNLTERDLYRPETATLVEDFVDKKINDDPLTVKQKLRQITSKGQFVPIDTTGVILYPGADGGAEWGGAAVDPRTGVMYVNSNEMAWIVRLSKTGEKGGKKLSRGQTLAQLHCARCHGGELQGLSGIPELQQVKNRLAPEVISSIIQKGKGAMPGMPNLTEAEVKSLTQFLSGLEESEEGDHRAVSGNEVPYAVAGFGRFKDQDGYPVVQPPWGTLNAIDLNTGEYLWKIPLGHEESLNDPEHPVSGLENYGGPVITEGGVLFIGATKDEKFRAFHMKTGKLLWETDLPAGGYATPATYSVNGRQFVVISCGGGKMGTKSGDVYRAFALPQG